MESEKEMELILQRIGGAERQRDSNYRQIWQDCYRRYRSRVKNKREGSNLFVPHTFMQVEVIKARITDSLFAARPYIAAFPREGSDLARAEKIQTLLDWQFNERMDMQRIIGEQAANYLVIYGTCITYTGWQVRTRLRRHMQTVMQPLTAKDGTELLDELGTAVQAPLRQQIGERVSVYDDPVVQNIDIFDFFVDPEATSIEDARYLGHKEYQTQAALDDLVRQGKYRINWKKLTPVSVSERGRKEQGDKDAAEFGESFTGGDAHGLYLVHHYWEEDRHVVIINRSQCVCDEPNPFWHGLKPYDKCCYVPLTDEFYGMGVPEIIAGLQDELNTTRNQRIDYNSMALRRMWKLRRGCGLTAKELLWRQNGILQVENMDDVMEINVAQLPSSAFANESDIKQDMQDTTGCQDILMGISYADETATTTRTRDNNAALRFKTVITAIAKDLLVPIARKCVYLNQQFLSENRAMRLLNDRAGELFEVSPYELDGDYDVIYSGAAVEPLADKAQNKESALQAYALAMKDAAYQSDTQARMRLFRRVLEALDIKDVDKMIPEAAEQQEQGQKQGLQILQGMQGQALQGQGMQDQRQMQAQGQKQGQGQNRQAQLPSSQVQQQAMPNLQQLMPQTGQEAQMQPYQEQKVEQMMQVLRQLLLQGNGGQPINEQQVQQKVDMLRQAIEQQRQ